MKSYNVQPFKMDLSHLAWCRWGVLKQVCVSMVHSFVIVHFWFYNLQPDMDYIIVVIYVAHTMFWYTF